MGITIVGLGPGDGRYLTLEALNLLNDSKTIYLRTKRHPAVNDLPRSVQLFSFDDIYDTAEDFNQVYEEIVERILNLLQERRANGEELIYAVPGHPLVGESTVTAIAALAEASGIHVTIVPGLSFVEPTLQALGVDALDGLQLFDAIEVARFKYPPLNSDIPVLLGQVYGKYMASELKLSLMTIYPDEHGVTLIHGAGTDNQSLEYLPLYEIDRSDQLAHLSSLYVPPLAYASTLQTLAQTIAYLRSPEGCPWDQEQSHQSLRSGFLEEMHEVLAAIDTEDMGALQEELGDLLYHVVMQIQIASEEEDFRLTDVIASIDSKLKRRHPHVWGDLEVADSAEVVRNWEALKKKENDSKTAVESELDNIPLSLPALALAQKIQNHVKRDGFDWPSINGVVAKVKEEIEEVEEADLKTQKQQEVGDLLFAVVNWARWLDVDAESSLREANLRFSKRYRQVERLANAKGWKLTDLDIEQLEELWSQAKSAQN